MKILDQEKDWLERHTIEFNVGLEVKLTVVNNEWGDYDAFLKEVQEIASHYGFEVDEK